MGRFGDDKIEEVRSRADIVEIVGAHVRLRRAGRNFVGLCPFHNEKTPSFSVNAERGFFHCFGCGAGGSVFNFIMRVEGLTFPEAVRSIARKYGVTIPEHDQSGPAAGEREAMLKASEVAAEFFAHVLWNTDDGAVARDYLKSRGISVETARAFILGFAPSRPASLAKALERRGLRDAGVKVGLVKKDGDGAYDMFRARVMFPIRDAQGRAIAFGGRVLDARLPKYINSPESPLYSKARTLYGLFEARQAISSNVAAGKDRAILVEGYFDVIALWQAGFKEAVAGCGTALTVEQLRALTQIHEKRDRVLRRRRGGAQGLDAGAGDFFAGGIAGPRDFYSVGLRSRYLRSRARRGRVRGAGGQSRIAGRLFSQRTGGRGARIDRRAGAGGRARRRDAQAGR